MTTDVGLTHVALTVSDLDRSVAFYERWARMQVVHRRADSPDSPVAWLSDLSRPFVVVLVQQAGPVKVVLGGFAHLGIGCSSRDEIDRLADEARAEGCLRLGPFDSGWPVGYWMFLADPDGHQLEFAYGQDVGLTVAKVANASAERMVGH
jgi:catechol 2,3-dioxygenase-like lactoylglutathione lyase family enzyme